MNTTSNSKTAIVTGAGQGIGEGIARTLASEGYQVIVADINLDNAAKIAADIGGHAVKCDVSSAVEVDNLINETISTYGKIDVLVNNAGIYPFKNFADMTEADWDKVIGVNLKSIFLTCSAASKKMSPGGKIVNISSIAAYVGFNGLTHYCATKGGINAFTRTLALELAPQKINVNGVAPGAIRTPGATSSDEAVVKQTIAAIPWQRMGEPVDIANAVAFLASDKADYITGQTLIVDGGYTLR